VVRQRPIDGEKEKNKGKRKGRKEGRMRHNHTFNDKDY